MYKDKEKQRQANKEAARRRRAKQGMTQGVPLEGMTAKGMTRLRGIALASDPETQAMWDLHRTQRRPTTYPHKFNNKTNLAVPGEPDYAGVCYKDEDGVWRC